MTDQKATINTIAKTTAGPASVQDRREGSNRIEDCLAALRRQNRTALIPFLVAGDPDLAATRELALAVLRAGADMLEVGVPFSDPAADGSVIMAASARALSGGTRLADVFRLAGQLRQETAAPLILLIYYNLILHFGVGPFFAACRDSGVDGVVVPDLPLEEQDEAQPAADHCQVALIRLVTPLSQERLPALTQGARGFLYCVAAAGVTGERAQFGPDLRRYARQVSGVSALPRALGFGISSAEQVRQLATDWDALIIGSALVRRIAESAAAGQDLAGLCRTAARFVAELRKAADASRAKQPENLLFPAPAADQPALLPDEAAFCRLAASHALIPVSCRLNADKATPVSLFQLFNDQRSAFLLESVLGGERWARYSIMGRKPLFRLVYQSRQLHIEPGTACSAEAAARLRQMTEKAAAADGGGVIGLIRDLLSAFALPAELCGLGFRCGLVGYFAYDFVRCLENLPDNNPDDLFLPDCDLSVPGEVVLYDHLKHELTLVCNQWASRGCNADHRADYRAAARILQGLAGALSAGSPPVQQAGTQPAGTDGFWSNVSRERFLGQVRLARQYIRQGDIFQVVLSQRFSAVFGGDPFAVYRALRQVNPSPYLFYLQLPGAVLAGASPEMLVRLTGKQIETCPIAGTRRRGATAEDDDRLAAGLLLDSKELAEHAMLVDLARNDVGRISRFGSVEVKDFCHVERFSHVMHLVSLVNGELCDDASAIDVLASLLPAGTLSGAPKIRAMEIIDELETCRRGPYGGAVGYLGFDGSLDTCITIRTALIARERIHVQAGAGIVADSVPENEYEETVSKAMALFSAIGRAGDFQ